MDWLGFGAKACGDGSSKPCARPWLGAGNEASGKACMTGDEKISFVAASGGVDEKSLGKTGTSVGTWGCVETGGAGETSRLIRSPRRSTIGGSGVLAAAAAAAGDVLRTEFR